MIRAESERGGKVVIENKPVETYISDLAKQERDFHMLFRKRMAIVKSRPTDHANHRRQ